ncbi:hypothetical protein [Micromonospora sp. LOL_021]|uniref:hypothetical protein n=1 Tax=Micromonospora sp. LOL_021 TaxID=3345417 RepID=UPI003A854FDC
MAPGHPAPLWHNNQYAAQIGINNWGDIVGEYEPTPSGFPCYCRGARWHRGVLTDLGDLGSDGAWSNRPADVNNRREMVGSSTTHDGNSHACLWRAGTMIDLTTLGLRATDEVVEINSSGQIVGIRDGRATLFVR